MVKTPGYNSRITVKLSTTKTGQSRATYWSGESMRWLPLPRAEADLLLAMDQADAYVKWVAA